MYNNKLISHIFKYYKIGLKDISFFTTSTISINNSNINTSKSNISNTNNRDNKNSTNKDNNIGNITKELGRLERTENIIRDIDTLHRLVTSNVFIYDDRVQKALKDLSLLKSEIPDYETLLKAVEIFYMTNNSEIMLSILSYFSKDIPYLPNNILLQLTKYYTKKFKGNDLVEKLQSQLYFSTFNTLNTIGKISEQKRLDRAEKERDKEEEENDRLEKQKDREERKKDKKENENDNIVEQRTNISSSDVESILYCTNIINDQRIVYNTLNSIDLTKISNFKEVLNILKLYYILISNGTYRIEGFMTKFLNIFDNLLRNVNNSTMSTGNSNLSNNTSDSNKDNRDNTINDNSNNKDNDMSDYIYNIEGKNILDQKDIINCYRMLIKLRNYEKFDINKMSNIINDTCHYSCKDLTLVLKDLYYSSFELDCNVFMPIVKGFFDNITQLTKDDIVLLVRFLNKNGHSVKLTKDQDELVNFQVMLHISYYNSKDILNLLNYYINRNNKEDINVVFKLYNHLNNFDLTSDISIISNSTMGNSSIRNNNNKDNNNRNNTKDISNSNTNNRDNTINDNDKMEINDANTNIYVLSKFILYFNESNSLNSLMVRRYVRSLNRNYLSLNSKAISYSLYVLYKIGYNPAKLLNNLLPMLHTNLDRCNSVDLTQMLLFFNLFRLKYEHFYQVLVDKVQSNLLNHEFNDEQLVVISKCLCDYKKTFTSSLFNTISGRLDNMNISQICTVFNSYVKSGLNNQLFINNINELILNNLERLKYKDVIKLLLPIKAGDIQNKVVIDYMKNNYELEAGDCFDVFDVLPRVEDLDDQQVVKCAISLAKKERNTENDRFARSLFIKIIKITPKLNEKETSLIMNSIISYGYIKPKLNRILTNRLQKYNTRKLNAEKQKNEDKNLEIFKFFRHISKGPPHLDKVKN